jgi:hypothetical protein
MTEEERVYGATTLNLIGTPHAAEDPAIQADLDHEHAAAIRSHANPDAAPPLPCSSEGCGEAATAAIRFHGQTGHVHDCSAHLAILREWADIAEVVPLPCPWPCSPLPTRVDAPRELT